MMSRTLRLSDGARVRVVEAGAGAPVLLIHGVGLRAEAWGPQIADLSADHHVIAVDMPGHGDATDDAAGSAAAQITPTSAPAETAPTDPHANHSGN